MDHVLLSLDGSAAIENEKPGQRAMRWNPGLADRGVPASLDDYLFEENSARVCCHHGVTLLLATPPQPCPFHQCADDELAEKPDDLAAVLP